MSANKVILVGNIGKLKEMRFSKNGSPIKELSVATSDNKKDGETSWHNIVAFTHTAEFIDKYLQKGDKVYVEGRLKYERWEDENGVQKNMTKIIAYAIESMSGKPSTKETTGTKAQTQKPPQAATQNAYPVYDDDIPF